jgi:hypothetical protein
MSTGEPHDRRPRGAVIRKSAEQIRSGRDARLTRAVEAVPFSKRLAGQIARQIPCAVFAHFEGAQLCKTACRKATG